MDPIEIPVGSSSMETVQTVTCPMCGSSFELAAAFRQALVDDILAQERAVHRAEVEVLRTRVEQQTRQAVAEQLSIELEGARAEADEQRAINKELRQTLLDLNSQVRRLTSEREADALKLETLVRE